MARRSVTSSEVFRSLHFGLARHAPRSGAADLVATRHSADPCFWTYALVISKRQGSTGCKGRSRTQFCETSNSSKGLEREPGPEGDSAICIEREAGPKGNCVRCLEREAGPEGDSARRLGREASPKPDLARLLAESPFGPASRSICRAESPSGPASRSRHLAQLPSWPASHSRCLAELDVSQNCALDRPLHPVETWRFDVTNA